MDSLPIKFLVWNVRGLNETTRRSAIYQVVSAANPSIVCFQETKMEVVTAAVFTHCLANKFGDFYYLTRAHVEGSSWLGIP